MSQSSESQIETWTLGATVKATWPVFSWLEVFGGIGLGYTRATLTVPRGTFLFASQDIERSDSGLGSQLLAGFDLRFTQHWGLGFQWRKHSFDADFGRELGGTVQVGGHLGLLHTRWVF